MLKLSEPVRTPVDDPFFISARKLLYLSDIALLILNNYWLGLQNSKTSTLQADRKNLHGKSNENSYFLLLHQIVE